MPTTRQSRDKHHPYEITEKVSEFTEDALNKIDDTANTVQQKTEEYIEPLQFYIQMYPLRSIGIAVLSGMVLASFLHMLHK